MSNALVFTSASLVLCACVTFLLDTLLLKGIVHFPHMFIPLFIKYWFNIFYGPGTIVDIVAIAKKRTKSLTPGIYIFMRQILRVYIICIMYVTYT